jgi:C-terminal processing protease CtpA/Prc
MNSLLRVAGLGLALTFLLPAMQMDRKLIGETVDSLASVVHREYVDAEMAARVDAFLRRSLAEGKYGDVQMPEALAAILTRDLFALTRDKHLSVAVVPDRASVAAAKADPNDSRETRSRRSNFGIQKVEILHANVGYINITAFDRPDQARVAISAAMQLLRNAEALIVDLRTNGGGSPDTAALFASYFFDVPGLALFEIVPRSGEVKSYRTETTVLPDRNGQRPVYLLTSASTFSAGEGFAFLLQERHRAEVIGETTAGAANPGRPYPMNSRFEVTVPNGRVRSAVGGGNWEGVGVTPDVKTPALEALGVAQARAMRRLAEKSKDPR